MSKLTLEQVLVILDKRAAQFAKLGEGQAAWELRESWNAIEAALKTQGEPVAWPKSMVNAPVGDGSDDRIIGFRVPDGDPILGEFGISEPLAWLRRVTVDRFAAPPADDRPTWEEVRAMLIRGYADGYEDHQCDISGRPGKSADRILAEFRKEKGND